MSSIETQNAKSVSVYFSGGTGGHYALWLILLGTDYRCRFRNFELESDDDLNTLFGYFWKKQQTINWANHEIEIDNSSTEQDNNLDKKVFLYGDNDSAENFGKADVNIVIYTDVLTQCLMLIEKQSMYGLFYNIDVTNQDMLKQSANELADLVPCVRYKNKFISSYYKDTINIDSADAAFDLVDLVKNKGKPLLDFLSVADSDAAYKFTKEYVKLHSPTTGGLFI